MSQSFLNFKLRLTLWASLTSLLVAAFMIGAITPRGAAAMGDDQIRFAMPEENLADGSFAPAAGGPIYKYLIHLGTGGPVGCGDSLSPVYVGKRSGDVKKDIATALKSLFATPKHSGGLYNPLAESKLRVRRVDYVAGKKNPQIFLGGKFVRPKTYCESARARAMVWATAQQFPEVRHATIWLGSALLGDMLAPTERTYDN